MNPNEILPTSTPKPTDAAQRQCGKLRDGTISKHGCGNWVDAAGFSDRNLCTTCLTLYRRADSRSRAEQMRASVLWRKFRITPEDYDRMRAEQDYRCPICLRHEDEIDANFGRTRLDGSDKHSGGAFVVDHCHVSNIVRRLLCSRCNQGIGHLFDSPDVLRNAMEYLLAHQHLLDETPRDRTMPLTHNEELIPRMCRNGLHERTETGRCKPCATAKAERQRCRTLAEDDVQIAR